MMIRAARAEDAQNICAIWNPLIENSATTFTSTLKTQAGIQADIEARNGAFFVAVEGDEALGFATYFPFRSGPGYLRTKEHSINLAPRAQGLGVGTQLMETLEEHAFEADVHSLWAGISGENPSGVIFHERCGFAHIARLTEVGYKFGRWMDLVLMQKILG